MNVFEIAAEVARINAIRGDAEMAHSAEDNLRDSVLHAIAEGAADAPLLARAALETNKIEFARWCA